MKLEAIGVAEGYFGEWCTSTRIVNDVFDDAANVTVFFCVVKGSKLRRSLVEASMGRCVCGLERTLLDLGLRRTEYGSTTLPLIADYPTHLDSLDERLSV